MAACDVTFLRKWSWTFCK